MNVSKNKRVDAFLTDLQYSSVEIFERVLSIRKLFFIANKNLTENIKYGGLVFFKSDTLIAGIFVYKKHLSIEFGEGASFADPHGVLEGSGKNRRHIKIHQGDDIVAKKCRHFINLAVKGSAN